MKRTIPFNLILIYELIKLDIGKLIEISHPDTVNRLQRREDERSGS